MITIFVKPSLMYRQVFPILYISFLRRITFYLHSKQVTVLFPLLELATLIAFADIAKYKYKTSPLTSFDNNGLPIYLLSTWNAYLHRSIRFKFAHSFQGIKEWQALVLSSRYKYAQNYKLSSQTDAVEKALNIWTLGRIVEME